jgi:hypothetical protein
VISECVEFSNEETRRVGSSSRQPCTSEGESPLVRGKRLDCIRSAA